MRILLDHAKTRAAQDVDRTLLPHTGADGISGSKCGSGQESSCILMTAEGCVLAFRGGSFGDLVAPIVSRQSIFVAAQLEGREHCPQMVGNLGNVGQEWRDTC